MKRKGTGSKNSPIAIDDSEEEVVLGLWDANGSNNDPTTRSRSAQDQDGRLLPGNMVHNEAIPNGKSRQKDRDLQVHGGQKRKRTQADQHDDYAAGPSRFKLPPPTLEARFSNPASKKARKRRRKLERQAMESDTRSKQQVWLNEMNGRNRFLPNQILPTFSWAPDTLPYNVLDPISPTSPYIIGNKPYPSLRQDLPNGSYITPPLNDSQPYDTNLNDYPIASTSAWVSSMAMAAENPTQIVVDSWHPPSRPQPSHTQWSATPDLGPTISHHAPVHPLPPKPPVEKLSAAREPPEPPKPPPPPIGMKPDQDPSSKHGIFEIIVSASGSSPYIPNPARTLVIEQLPKSHRNADWVNSWCKFACGALPVHLSINGQGAKALVEFATSDLARKAWGSPRLGSNFAGLKPFQLKGKPREDLIKVWWYRVDGVGAGAGVGEIEEGEIEGDAAEKEVEVMVKKETKKERKARLAKERLEKQKQQLESAKTRKEPQPHHQLMPTSFSSRPPTLRPGLPTPVQHKQVDQQVNLPPVSQSVSYSASYHHQQPSSRPRILPQSDLRAQWSKQPESAQKIDKTSYGASQQTSGVNSADGESIASSRTPSPVQLSPSEHDPPPSTLMTSLDELPDIMDVDDANIDIDTDSPTTSRHPLPKTRTAPSDSSFSLSAPAPRIALHASIPSPEADSVIPASVSALASSNGTSLAPSAQNSLRHLSSASAHSSTPQGTPPLEPRAMKNAPKAPSYTKRYLLARHRDLEEKIAKSKQELGLETPAAGTSVTPAIPSDPPSQNHDEEDKEGMEERLRMLVLRSRRSELKAGTPPTPPTTASSALLSTSGGESSDSSNSSTSAVTPAPATSDGAAGFSLDDLAVSFITETIQIYKTGPMPKTVPIKPPPHVNSNTRLELAAKQKRLEQEIAETKILMAKLTQARTKQEKDAILAEMRRRSRIIGEDANTTPPQAVNDKPPQTSINWPKSHRDAGVLIVSDDEDDSDSEDDSLNQTRSGLLSL